MELLKKELDVLKQKIADKYDLSNAFLSELYSVYPFNSYEYVISHLLATDTIDIEKYYDLRDGYLARNKFLHLYELAPRTFGETWAQCHLAELVQELQRPSRRLDENYKGEYDFWLDGIKIEVKASRAVHRKSGDSLMNKAIASDTNTSFDMNFQQIKPTCCHVFVWIGVWKDMIRYWVLSSKEVENNAFYSKGQHRGNTGEGQLWIKNTNIEKFNSYLVEPRKLLEKILEKAGKP